MVVATAAMVAGCGDPEPVEPPSLSNTAIIFPGFDSLSVQLVDGRGESFDGDVLVATAGLTDWVVRGDLDGDGVPGAVAVVWVSGGGSGTFFDLSRLELEEDAEGTSAWSWQGSVFLGDRIRVRALTLDGDVVELHLTDHGPDDGMCCPTRQTIRRYRVTATGFAEEVDAESGAGIESGMVGEQGGGFD